jgi:hypothetical protein
VAEHDSRAPLSGPEIGRNEKIALETCTFTVEVHGSLFHWIAPSAFSSGVSDEGGRHAACAQKNCSREGKPRRNPRACTLANSVRFFTIVAKAMAKVQAKPQPPRRLARGGLPIKTRTMLKVVRKFGRQPHRGLHPIA